MIDIDDEALRGMGLTPAVRQAAATLQGQDRAVLRRITEVHRDAVRLHDGRVELAARPSPRLERDLDERGEALAVGDWVLAADDPHGQAWVHARVPPFSRLARRDANGRPQAIASNVDTALVVMGLDGDFNPRRAERYLAMVQAQGVAPVIVLTKADVVGGAVTRERSGALRRRVPALVDVVAVNGTSSTAVDVLAPWLDAGRTLVLLGSSGAGKSTLTNTLLGRTVQATGAVREHDSRGKHTTTSRSLFRLPGGACLVDTPGLRSLHPDVDESTLAASFGDVDALAAACRFRDCAHRDEPGCAVRAAVDPDRLRNYHKLLRDARRDAMSALERQRQLGEWKARSKAAKASMRAKGRG